MYKEQKPKEEEEEEREEAEEEGQPGIGKWVKATMARQCRYRPPN